MLTFLLLYHLQNFTKGHTGTPTNIFFFIFVKQTQNVMETKTGDIWAPLSTGDFK